MLPLAVLAALRPIRRFAHGQNRIARIAITRYRPGIDSWAASVRRDRRRGWTMTTRTLKSILLAATAAIALTGAAAAANPNSIAIDVSGTGSTSTLAITQDDANLANSVSNLAGNGPLPVRGPWSTVSIDQQGGNNALRGSLQANTGSTTASLSASYAGGNNTHTLNVGGTAAPTNPRLTINVTNNGAGTNTISDTLNGTAVTYGLTILGTSNSLTNSVAASGAVALNQTITGSNNTVGNTVSGVASFTHNLALTGSGNTIANTASGGGAKTIGQTIVGSNNSVTVGLTGTGTQSSTLTTDSWTKAAFTETSAANNTAAVVGLSNVIGAAGAAAKVVVNQTTLADNATANVNVAGGAFTMGTIPGSLVSHGFAGSPNPGVYVYQNSPSATLNAVVTAGANGYSAKFFQ